MLYSVCYDIANDARRRKLVKLLKGCAVRVQESVFEAELDSKRLVELQTKIRLVIHGDEDSVRFYRICASCRLSVDIIGTGPPVREEVDILVV